MGFAHFSTLHEIIFNPSNASESFGKGITRFFTAWKSYKWMSPKKNLASGNSWHFGAINIGWPGSGYVSEMAADAFVASRDAYLIIGTMGKYPMHTKITVNFPSFLSLKLGNPTTFWDTIIINRDKFKHDRTKARSALAHELGHVLFNTYHSGWGHWALDGIKYMQFHNICGAKSESFAYYEGFAHFVKDYVQAYQIEYASYFPTRSEYFDTGALFAGCVRSGEPNKIGLNYEGNVAAMFNQYHFGHIIHSRMRNARNTFEHTGISAYNESGHLAWYDYPSSYDIPNFIQKAGTKAHSARQLFQQQIHPHCLRSTTLSDNKLWCDSFEFRSGVMGTLDHSFGW